MKSTSLVHAAHALCQVLRGQHCHKVQFKGVFTITAQLAGDPMCLQTASRDPKEPTMAERTRNTHAGPEARTTDSSHPFHSVVELPSRATEYNYRW